MVSKLLFSQLEEMDDIAAKMLAHHSGSTGVYVSLNNSAASLKDDFEKRGVDTKKIFFIDCVSSRTENSDAIHPSELEEVYETVMSNQEKKFIIIDAFSSLMIYNTQEALTDFTKKLCSYTSKNNLDIYAITTKTESTNISKTILECFDEIIE